MSTSYRNVDALPNTRRKIIDEINPVRRLVHRPATLIVILMLVHPLLALAMRASAAVATLHALLVVGTGLIFALFSRDVRKVSFVAAYIAGAEVLWRMTSAHIPWEAAKYITVLLLGIAFLRTKSWQRVSLPFLFFLLLCLSLPLTISALGISRAARDAISFNMSGPLALMVCAFYFSQVTFDEAAMRRVVWWTVLPIVGIATLVLSGILATRHIIFADESNFVTSGGFGPNQVSAILGLGSGLLFLVFITGRQRTSRWIAIFLALFLLTLSIFTFSRGGLYNTLIMVSLALAHSLRNARMRNAAIMVLLIVGLVGGYLIFPSINAYTGGLLEQRYANLDPTLRLQIAKSELELWFSNPALGVGPGMAKTARIVFLNLVTASHTEYTRVLAEHGTAGALALLFLLIIAIRAYLRAPSPNARIWVIALLAWPLVEMSHAAMRVDAIAFIFGLALVNWDTGLMDVQSLVKKQ